MHIVELQRKLQEARNDEKIINHYPSNGISSSSNSSSSKYRSRIAAVDHHRDASELLELGVSPGEVSVLLGMPLSEVARIQEYNQKRRKFLTTGNLDLPGQAAGLSIFQK